MNTTAVFKLAATLSALSAFAAPLTAQTAPELLAKYNFEGLPTWVPNWGAGHGSTYKPATGWKTPFKVSLDTDNPHTGDNALRFELIESSEKEKLVHGPSIKIVAPAEGAAERKLLVRLAVRSTGVTGKGVGIRVLERDEKNASIRLLGNKNSLIPVPDSAGWVELEAEGSLHSRTRSVTFMVVAYQSEVPATVWIDDVSVELLPASAR